MTAAVTPRGSDKGAERWGFLPSCGEAVNPSLIPALRLPRAAHVCPEAGGAPVESGTHPGHPCCEGGCRTDGRAGPRAPTPLLSTPVTLFLKDFIA